MVRILLFDLPLEDCFLRRCRGYYLNHLRCLNLRTLQKFELFLVHCKYWFLKLPEAAFPKLSIVSSISACPLRFIMRYDRVWNMFVGSFLRMESYHTWLFAYFCLCSSRSLPFRETMQLGSRFQLLSVGYVFVIVLIVKPLGANEFFGSDIPDIFL